MADFLELNFKQIDVIEGGDGSDNGEIGFEIRVNGQVVSHRWGDEIRTVANGGTIPLNFKMRIFSDATIFWHAWDVDTFRDDDAGSDTQTFRRADIDAVGTVGTSTLVRNGVSLKLEFGVSRGTDSSVLWEQRTGRARDVGVGADGSVWVIGTNPVGTGFAGDFGIYRLNGSTWEGVDGGAARIAVGPDGKPWVVNKDGEIFHRVLNSWVKFPGLAKDIGIGAEGSVWIIGTNRVGTAGDFGIYKLVGENWSKVEGGGVRIAVGPDGMPWVVNSVGQVFRRAGNSWTELPGRGTDIGVGKVDDFVGSKTSAWLIGTDRVGTAGDFGIYELVDGNWSKVGGGAIGISVGLNGKPWVVNSAGSIFSRI
jgi:Tectonin domain